MSRYNYEAAIALHKFDPPFYSLIMAAMLKADTSNASRLRIMWPDIHNEFHARYHSPGGRLVGDPPFRVDHRELPDARDCPHCEGGDYDAHSND